MLPYKYLCFEKHDVLTKKLGKSLDFHEFCMTQGLLLTAESVTK